MTRIGTNDWQALGGRSFVAPGLFEWLTQAFIPPTILGMSVRGMRPGQWAILLALGVATVVVFTVLFRLTVSEAAEAEAVGPAPNPL